MNKPFTFTIVGGGLTATSMLCQFVEKAAVQVSAGKLDPRVIDMSLFEKTDQFGPGFPHNHRYLMPFHITNMCAADMGVYADRPGDFQVWVDRHLDRLKARYAAFPPEAFGSAPGPCRHYPRAFMGAYLQARFNQAVAAARKQGMTVTLYPRHEITDIRRAGGRVRVVAHGPPPGGCPERFADAVLLATGHWFTDSRQENFFGSPWPAKKLLANIPPGARLAVIGTSLSAIETVLTLTSDGRFVGHPGGRLTYIPSNTPRRITLYSRSGLLPRVRGKLGAHVNRFLTPSALQKIHRQNHGRQTLAATFALLNAELEAIYGRPMDWQQLLEPADSPADALHHYLKEAETGDGPEGAVVWQTVLYQAFTYIREWYLKLTDHDRQRFDRDYTSAFFAHAATQPRINAAKLLALFNADLVSVVRLGKRYRFYRDDHGQFCFDYTDCSGQIKSDRFRYVVNARGQATSLTTDTSQLAQNLLASIHAQSDQQPADRVPVLHQHTAVRDREAVSDAARNGSIRIDPQTHRVVRPDFGPGSAVYAVGAMTRGQIIDTSMAHGISRSAATIADNLIHRLSGWR